MEYPNFKLINFADVGNPYCNIIRQFIIHVINIKNYKVESMESLTVSVAFQIIFISSVFF